MIPLRGGSSNHPTVPGVLGHAPRRPFARLVDVADGVWLVVGVQAAGKSTVADCLPANSSVVSTCEEASSTGGQ
jgi:hypothetical protein